MKNKNLKLPKSVKQAKKFAQCEIPTNQLKKIKGGIIIGDIGSI